MYVAYGDPGLGMGIVLPIRNVIAFAVACQCLTKNLTNSVLNGIDTMTLIVL